MRRVVITGIGAVSPLGNTADELWNGVKEGKNGIDRITHFDLTDFKCTLAGEAKGFDPANYIDRKEVNRMDRFCHFGIAAAVEAVADSGVDLEKIDREMLGVLVGSGMGGMKTYEDEVRKLVEKGPKRISPLFVPMAISNMTAGNIAIRFGAKGVCSNVVTACATGSHCVGEAFLVVRDGRADMMIAGGAEACITPLGIAGFINMTAVSFSTDKDRASIPFDAERNGFVMGEGAGILILEEYEHAVKRGAKIYAEITGYGATCDAYHMTSPDPEGSGAARAMKIAMDMGGIKPERVGYINAHGTSTPYNDKFETRAIKKAFGEELARKVAISSSKSMTGHMLGAAGAVEAIICAKTLQEGYITPTINYKVADAECDLDYVPNTGRKADVKYALSNSLGFGGHNATVLLKKYEG